MSVNELFLHCRVSKPSMGHSLTALGAENEQTVLPVWRCPVCTFSNAGERNVCGKCKEPMADELKERFSVAKEKPMKTVGDGVFRVKAQASVPVPLRTQPPAVVSANKANIHGVVRSKLNHDTASYRGKFEDPNEPAVKVHTLATSTKNGFVSSAKPAVAKDPVNAWEAHQNKPLKKMSAADMSSKPRSTIEMLQQAATGNAIASLKHTGVEVAPEKKAMAGGQYSKYEM